MDKEKYIKEIKEEISELEILVKRFPDDWGLKIRKAGMESLLFRTENDMVEVKNIDG